MELLHKPMNKTVYEASNPIVFRRILVQRNWKPAIEEVVLNEVLPSDSIIVEVVVRTNGRSRRRVATSLEIVKHCCWHTTTACSWALDPKMSRSEHRPQHDAAFALQYREL